MKIHQKTWNHRHSMSLDTPLSLLPVYHMPLILIRGHICITIIKYHLLYFLQANHSNATYGHPYTTRCQPVDKFSSRGNIKNQMFQLKLYSIHITCLSNNILQTEKWNVILGTTENGLQHLPQNFLHGCEMWLMLQNITFNRFYSVIEVYIIPDLMTDFLHCSYKFCVR